MWQNKIVEMMKIPVCRETFSYTLMCACFCQQNLQELTKMAWMKLYMKSQVWQTDVIQISIIMSMCY